MTPDTWWEISTTHNSVIRVSEEEKERLIGALHDYHLGALAPADRLVEGLDVSGTPYGCDVSCIDAWWFSDPASRDRQRHHNARIDDECDTFDRREHRGKYEQKQWSPEDEL